MLNYLFLARMSNTCSLAFINSVASEEANLKSGTTVYLGYDHC